MQPVLDRMSWFPFQDLKLIASKEYLINAHWALYVDNYLEGYHVPFVHPDLNKALDPKGYEYHLFPGGALQIGRARGTETAVFAIPDHAEDAGERIYAYYWWLFPNMMWNIYPWGVSLNSVEPVNLTTTRVRFLTFLLKDSQAPDFESIHRTELEDEAIVEQVQKGINSSFYKAGRYAPEHESAVHHFHRQLARYLSIIGQT
jgi:choline monooxygenase